MAKMKLTAHTLAIPVSLNAYLDQNAFLRTIIVMDIMTAMMARMNATASQDVVKMNLRAV